VNTLDAVLHDALAQSERFHAGLAAPSVRSTIARKRVVRRAAMSSAATVGAVGIGAGGFALSAGFAPSDLAAVGSSMSITPSGSTSPAPSGPTSPTPSASPTPTATAAADPAALAASQRAFCQQLPLIVAWSEAAGTTATELSFTYSSPGDPISIGCLLSNATLSDPMSTQWIYFIFGSTPGSDFTRQRCVDDKGTMTFETNAPTEQSAYHSRSGIACLDGVLVIANEAVQFDANFTLTDAQMKAPAEASVAMADKARLLAP